MKVLVTGGAGYIGSVATYILLNEGYRVTVFDNFSTGNEGALKYFTQKFPDKFNCYNVDLKDRELLVDTLAKEKEIEFVLHYAASCSVDESMENPGRYFENNVCGTNNLLSAITKFGIKRLVFSSTCAVYGETQHTPVDEKHPTSPVNPYGESKLMVEKMIEWYSRLKGINYVIMRYFNICGASDDGEVGDSKKPSSHLMQNAIRGALDIDKFFLTCPRVDTPDGTPIRDYINVVDLNIAHIKALNYLKDGGKNQIINLGTGTGNSVLEIVEKVEEITGKKLDREQGEARKGEYAKVYADISKARRVLGWEPKRSIEDSVKSLVKWYTKHPNGWEN